MKKTLFGIFAFVLALGTGLGVEHQYVEKAFAANPLPAYTCPGSFTNGDLIAWTTPGNCLSDAGAQSGRLIGTQVFCTGTGSNCTSTNCSSGCTYTPTAGTNSIRVTVIAPGGGGGGNVACTTTTGTAGSTGGAGEVIVATATTGFSGATVTVPAGGAGGANTGANGTTGGNTTFIKSLGISITANGGGGGNGTNSTSPSGASNPGGAGGAKGGTVSGATVIVDIAGGTGSYAAWSRTSGIGFSSVGPSGAPGLGFGTGSPGFSNPGADLLGTAGTGYGYGGAIGSLCLDASGSAHAGGAGGDGLVIVEERS